MLLTPSGSCQISCGRRDLREEDSLSNEAQSQVTSTKHMVKLIRSESRCVRSFRWPADLLIMWVLAGDLLMSCLMRLDCTVRLSSSLHASHDTSVSVTPFNPITPTWSDTNSITSFLLLHLLASPLLISWYSSCHQSGFYSLMSWKAVASGIALPPFLSFIFHFFIQDFGSAGKNQSPW